MKVESATGMNSSLLVSANSIKDIKDDKNVVEGNRRSTFSGMD